MESLRYTCANCQLEAKLRSITHRIRKITFLAQVSNKVVCTVATLQIEWMDIYVRKMNLCALQYIKGFLNLLTKKELPCFQHWSIRFYDKPCLENENLSQNKFLLLWFLWKVSVFIKNDKRPKPPVELKKKIKSMEILKIVKLTAWRVVLRPHLI